MSEESLAIVVTNDYPKEKYNLLIPVKTMQMPSNMFKVIVNEVQLDSNAESGDVYVQIKGDDGKPDRLALTKNALSKLMKAAGITIKESKAIIPSTHKSAIEMAKAIGKVVPYDARDIAHEVVLLVPEDSGQFSEVHGNKEFIIENLKAEMLEQKKYMKVWDNKKQRAATDQEKAEAVEKQLTQFLSHARAQCESKALNRALRQAMQIKSTYTATELSKPFIVARVVPNLDNPEFKNLMLQQYAASTSILFPNTKKVATIAAPADEITQETHESEIPLVEAEIVASPEKPYCEKCGSEIEPVSGWSVDKIVEYSVNKFKGKKYCPDCQRDIWDEIKKANGK